MQLEQWAAVSGLALRYREQKGFVPCEWDTVPIRLQCLCAELEELDDAITDAFSRPAREWPTLAVRDELADVCAYALTLLCDLAGQSWTIRGTYHGGTRRSGSPADMLRPLRRHVHQAFEFWRRGRRNDVVISIELLVAALCDLRTRVLCIEGSIAHDIALKLERAESRPARHGGKDARS